MADPSIKSVPVAPIGKRWKSVFTLILAITGRMLVIAGGILTGASAVLPWLHLSIVVNADGMEELYADPWTILQLSGGGALLFLALGFLLVALGIFIICAAVAFNRRVEMQSALTILLLVLILLYIGGMFLLLSVVPMELSHVSHAYKMTVQYGAGVVVLGCLSAAFGAPMVLVARPLSTSHRGG